MLKNIFSFLVKPKKEFDIEEWIPCLSRENYISLSERGAISPSLFDKFELYIGKYKRDIWFSSSAGGYLEMVQFLLEDGININAQGNYESAPSLLLPNSYGSSALMHAAQNGHLDIVKVLVEAGANIEVRNWGGETALYFAVKSDHLNIVKFLIEKGATGNTALMLAIESDSFEVFQFLTDELKIAYNINELLKNSVESGAVSIFKYLYGNKNADGNAWMSYKTDIRPRNPNLGGTESA